MSDTSQLPTSQQTRTDEDAAAAAAAAIPRQMSQASLFNPQFSNPYQAQYPTPQPTYTYSQQSYVPQQMTLQQHGHSLPTHYQQAMPHTMPTYSQQTTMTSGYPRKRTASEMDTPLLGSGVSLASSGYPMANQGLMTAATMPAVSSVSGLGISTMAISYEADPNNPSLLRPVNLVPPTMQPKKGRTNTPWTPAEEQRLKVMREAGNSWSEIAKTFPNRTEGSVKKHWYKDMHYADFADDEGSFKQALIAAIKDYEQNKWKVIGAKVGKPAKACESYAKEHNLIKQL